MNCERTRALLGAHLDRELDAVNDRDLQEHLRGCARCLRAAEQQEQMKRLVRGAARYHRAPAGLEARIRATLSGAPADAPPESGGRNRGSAGFAWFRPWAGGLAAAAAMVLAMWTGSAVTSRRAAADYQAEELVSAHVRSLLGTHLTDVLSSDQHTVKPWFDGKVDFAPPVRDLAAEGFPLAGGRVDYVAGHAAAALVFQRNKHFINVFVWPAAAGAAPAPGERTLRGYNLISWRQGDLALCAVSDLNTPELREFTERFRKP